MYQFYSLNRAMLSTRLVGDGNGYGKDRREGANERNSGK